eukprot:TRINITY_DN758_c0_g1_i15.p1 TRINITY_DN758_c0_g1~~TRINITY_DN758_c0_g1_i15.p1  ORF type:complete len:115 (+),score=15.84 TRINITY_DN758_c0_g1_i15:191-535(+)
MINQLYIKVLPGQFISLQESVCCVSPTQFAPPPLGVGLVHALTLLIVPPPQVTVHGVQLVHSSHSPCTGTIQVWKLQFSFSSDSPSQSLPPAVGSGESHLLDLVLVPVPHSAEH